MNFLLLTTANQTPILVGDNGVTVEPEVATGRSVVILPNSNREKHKIIVQESFWDIVEAAQPVRIWPAQPEPLPEAMTGPAKETIADKLSMPDGDDIEFNPGPEPEKKRKARAKKDAA